RRRGGGRGRGVTRQVGVALVALAVTAGVAAPWIAPHATDARFPGLLNAPPTLPHLVDDRGAWHAPFIYRWRLVSQLEQRYEADRSRRAPIAWFSGGHLIASADASAPLLLAGADSF